MHAAFLRQAARCRCENIKDRIRVTYIWDNGLLTYKDSPIDRDKKTFERLIKNRKEI